MVPVCQRDGADADVGVPLSRRHHTAPSHHSQVHGDTLYVCQPKIGLTNSHEADLEEALLKEALMKEVL